MWQSSPYACPALPVDVVSAAVAELTAEKDRLARLHSAAVELAHCLTTTEVLSAAPRLACETLDCESAALWMTPRGGRPRLAATPGLRAPQRRHLRELLSSWQAPEDHRPRVLGPVEGLGSAGIALVPLVARRSVVGALCLIDGEPAHWDDDERLSLAVGIAPQIALALQNAMRYDNAQFLAERDSLTRLFNHRGLTRRLEAQVAHAAQGEQIFSVVMMDIDTFKLFNDAHGHVMGDKVLQITARSISACLRRSDVAARCGGDEFVAILADCDERAAASLLARVRLELQKRALVVGGHSIPIKMSCGIATFPRDGDGAGELLSMADTNLYRSKRRGGDTVTATGGDEHHDIRGHSEGVSEYAIALAAELGGWRETEWIHIS